jgi:hypothetical protein
MAINPSSKFFVSSYTAITDDPFRLSDDPNLVLQSCNIHCYTNDAYYGNSLATPGIIRANAVMWFDSPLRPFDLMFKNLTPGSNTTIVIIGPL